MNRNTGLNDTDKPTAYSLRRAGREYARKLRSLRKDRAKLEAELTRYTNRHADGAADEYINEQIKAGYAPKLKALDRSIRSVEKLQRAIAAQVEPPASKAAEAATMIADDLLEYFQNTDYYWASTRSRWARMLGLAVTCVVVLAVGCGLIILIVGVLKLQGFFPSID